MKERPIIMGGESIRAILEGRKTQTRRVIKPPAAEGTEWANENCTGTFTDCMSVVCARFYKEGFLPRFSECPYGKPGERLWVRETFACVIDGKRGILYRVDQSFHTIAPNEAAKEQWEMANRRGLKNAPIQLPIWKPSIHMPRWASRLTLELCRVRVERLQEITEEDVRAEGIECRRSTPDYPIGSNRPDGRLYYRMPYPDETIWASDPKEAYRELWDSINGKRPGCSWAESPFVWVLEFRRVTP